MSDANTEYQTCTKCKTRKPITSFYKRGNGRRKQCKICYKSSPCFTKKDQTKKGDKICSRCTEKKPAASFRYGSTRCKRCQYESSKCPCGKVKSRCIDHGGSALCKCGCGKLKQRCKKSGGSSFCPCGKYKTNCKIHGGSAYCKCGKLKRYCKVHGGGAYCECGTEKKYCKKHGGASLCECGKRRIYCTIHGGSALCECGKHKAYCKKHGGSQLCDCGKRKKYCDIHGGSGLCECGKYRRNCKIHGGDSFCECGKKKRLCTIHGGSGLCPCGKRKERCKEHGGSAICECGKRKAQCVIHGGSALCECGKQRYHCKIHGGSSWCECGKKKRLCSIHGGSGLCAIHGVAKQHCKSCGGSAFCDCGKRKGLCSKHGGSQLCDECRITQKNRKYGDGKHCFGCYIFLNPDCEAAKRHRVLKEDYIDDVYKEMYPDFKWTQQNKRVPNDCNIRRQPDYLQLCLKHALILELDEKQHKRGQIYNNQCKIARLNEICEALNNLPTIYIRFNPDSYIDINGQRIDGCFTLTPKIGTLKLLKEPLQERLKVVHETVLKYCDWNNAKQLLGDDLVKQVYLFYDHNDD